MPCTVRFGIRPEAAFSEIQVSIEQVNQIPIPGRLQRGQEALLADIPECVEVGVCGQDVPGEDYQLIVQRIGFSFCEYLLQARHVDLKLRLLFQLPLALLLLACPYFQSAVLEGQRCANNGISNRYGPKLSTCSGGLGFCSPNIPWQAVSSSGMTMKENTKIDNKSTVRKWRRHRTTLTVTQHTTFYSSRPILEFCSTRVFRLGLVELRITSVCHKVQLFKYANRVLCPQMPPCAMEDL